MSDAPATPPAASTASAPPPAAEPAANAPARPSRAEVLLDKGARVTGRGARVVFQELSERRGLRTVLVGVILTLLALQLGSDSALALPLLIVGIVMLIVGAMGPRLRGHVGLDFGPEGTAFTMHTHVAPPGRKLAAAPVADSELPARPRIALVPTAVAAAQPVVPEAEPADADVVESSGETVEIDVAQLRALLEAEERRANAG